MSSRTHPAAAWAARSGDPILFADGDEVPESTSKVVRKHPDAPIYVLGPESAISDKAIAAIQKKSKSEITRVGEEDPVENSIAFARFVDGDFGWNINDPGHGFTVANISRPLDAAVGAPLSAGGKPGPLLVTDDAGAAVAETARETGLSEAEVLAVPFLLIGTQAEIVAATAEHERRWGITRHVVRADAVEAVGPLLDRLGAGGRRSGIA